MKKSLQRTISLLGSLALLIGAMIIYSYLIRPEYQQVNELRGILMAKTNLLSEQQSIISQVEDLLSQYQSSARIQETVSLSLPTKEDASAIFGQLQALSQANAMSIEVFGLQNLPVTKSGLGVLQVSLKVAGSYENFKNFLRGIETNIRVMDLSNLKIEKSSYNIVLNTYYQEN